MKKFLKMKEDNNKMIETVRKIFPNNNQISLYLILIQKSKDNS